LWIIRKKNFFFQKSNLQQIVYHLNTNSAVNVDVAEHFEVCGLTHDANHAAELFSMCLVTLPTGDWHIHKGYQRLELVSTAELLDGQIGVSCRTLPKRIVTITRQDMGIVYL